MNNILEIAIKLAEENNRIIKTIGIIKSNRDIVRHKINNKNCLFIGSKISGKILMRKLKRDEQNNKN